MAFQPIDITRNTVYGAARTTSFTTTITGSSDQRTFTNVLFPSPSVTIPVQYTTLPPPVDPASTYYSSSLPILVVMEAVAVVYNANGTPISTGTFLQTPSATALPTAQLLMNPECSSWSCWAPSEQIGTSIAIAFFIVGVLGLLWWGFCRKNRPKMDTRDLESGRVGSRQSHVRSRRRSRSDSSTSLSYTSSASSSGPSIQPQYQSYVRTRSRSRARYEEQTRASQGRRAQSQPRSHSPLYDTHIKDFAIPAAAGLAAAAALGGPSRNRGLSTTAIPRSSFHNDGVPRGRRSSDGTREYTGDRSRRSTNLDRPQARSHSPSSRSQPRSRSKHFGSGFGLSNKWFAVLPFVLDVLYRWSEPKGGWDEVRGKSKGIEQKAEDFGHELYEPRYQERSKSHRRSYRESPRRAQSVDAAYAKLRPRSPVSAEDVTTRGLDTNRIPRKTAKDKQANIMNHPDLNMSATAEAGSKRSPSPLATPPVGRSERRRITRREARRKRDGTGNSGVVTSDTEASTAGGQKRMFGEGAQERLRGSAPALSQEGYRTFPFPLPSKIDRASQQAATAPPVLGAQHSGIEQAQASLITPPDSDSR